MARTVNTGVDLYVEEGGSSGPTLLLLHGLGANGDVWKGMLPLLKQNWKGRWLIPDFRGHGRSGHRAPYSYASYAADVAALLEQGEEITAAGHSMGGLAAIALATGWFGVRINRAVAFSVKIRWTPEEVAKLSQLAAAPVRWFGSEAEAIDRYLKVSGLIGLVQPDAPEARSGIREENGRYRLAADPKINAAVGPDVADFITAAKAPIRLGAGSKDPMVDAADMTVFDPKAVVFEGLGHNAHVENPKTVWAFIAGEQPPLRNH